MLMDNLKASSGLITKQKAILSLSQCIFSPFLPLIQIPVNPTHFGALEGQRQSSLHHD